MATERKGVLVRLPLDLRKRFHLATIEDDTSMNRVMTELVEKWMKDRDDTGTLSST